MLKVFLPAYYYLVFLLQKRLVSKNKTFFTKKYYDYYYMRIISKYSSPSSYLKLLSNINSKKVINTKRPIRFSSSIKFGTNIWKFLIKMGKPNFWLIEKYNEKDADVIILLYKMLLGIYKAKIEFHFYNNRLFMYTITLSNLSSNDIEKIIEIMNKKYQLQEMNKQKLTQYTITNNYHDYITISLLGDKELSLQYFNSKHQAFRVFKELSLETEKRRKKYEKKMETILLRRI